MCWAIASLSPRERLRLELAKDCDQLVEVLKRALRSDNDNVALKAAVTWSQEAYGRPVETHRLEQAPIVEIPDRAAIEARLKELEGRYVDGTTRKTRVLTAIGEGGSVDASGTDAHGISCLPHLL